MGIGPGGRQGGGTAVAGVAALGRGARMPLGVSTREDPAAAGPAGGREEQSGMAEPIPAPAAAPQPCRAPLLFSRVIFPYGVEMQLGAARSLRRKRSLYCRRVYFAGAVAPLPRGHPACSWS